MEKNPLPIGLNRISWKLPGLCETKMTKTNALPIGLNRISWKRWKERVQLEQQVQTTLPIGLNRISWKRNRSISERYFDRSPTDWVKSD